MKYVSVDVRIDDVFGELSTDDLVEELKRRKESTDALRAMDEDDLTEELEELLRLIRARDYAEAELLAERIAHPKRASFAEALHAYHAARGLANRERP